MTEWYEPITAIGTLLSALITIAIAFFLYKQSRHSDTQSTKMTEQTTHLKDQTLEMKQEISNRMRPWIKIGDIDLTHVLDDKGRARTSSEFFDNRAKYGKLKEARYSCNIENVGSMPSKKCYVKILFRDKPITREILWDKGVTSEDIQPLMPKEKRIYRYALNAKDYNNLEKKPHYYGIHVGYYVNDKESNTVGKIWKLVGYANIISDYWIDKPE